MKNELKKPTKLSLALTLLPVTVFVLSVQGCADQETAPIKVQAQAATAPIAPPTAQAVAPTPPPAPIVEQYALDRLKQMSEQLVASKAFTYHANSSIEVQTAATGQFLTYFTDSEIALQRPNKFRAHVSGDVPSMDLYFDGTHVAAFDPEKNLYAVSEPIASIDEMLNFILTKAQVNFPSADLLYSNPYAVMTKNLTHAIVVGPSRVNGIPCEHFAYMEPGINWEIWIATGKKALPLRLAMTYKQVPNFPRMMVEFSNWYLNPKLKASSFDFKIPADATQIEFGTHRLEQKFKN